MKVGILAGGLGTRLSEETIDKPKPMVEIGGMPILWHIMNSYSAHGFDEFVIALGYKGEMIKEFFVNYHYRAHGLTVELNPGTVTTHDGEAEDWTLHLIDTGLETQTGDRVKSVAEFVDNETFMLTYGDGLCDVDLGALLDFHKSHGKLATVTAVRPPARFGGITLDGDRVSSFAEKPQMGEGWINGGFFVLEPGIADYIGSAPSIWERAPMERLSAEGELMAYRHEGFWQCMDTMRDEKLLENLWQTGEAKWKK